MLFYNNMTITYSNSDICTRKYKSFSIIYDLASRQILTLSDVSEDIWWFIFSNAPTNAEDISLYISNLYDIEYSQSFADTTQFIYELFESNIILIDNTMFSNMSYVDTDFSPNEIDLEGEIINCLSCENQLYSVTLEMTYACNEKCIHCYANSSTQISLTKPLSFNQYKDLIDDLYKMNCFHISFTGGDPFINTYTVDIFKYARSKGFICDFFTNGLYLADNIEVLNDILSYKPRAFYISIYGSSSCVHDSVTSVKGSFDKTISTIKIIQKHDIPVVLNIMILTTNYKDLPNIIQLAHKLKVEYRVSLSIINTNDGSSEPMKYFLSDTLKLKQTLSIINNNLFSMDYSVKKKQEALSYGNVCGAGNTSLCINPSGLVYPCVSLKNYLGNINQDKISDIWNGKNRLEFIQSLRWENLSNCLSCKYIDTCAHCPGISQSECGDMLACNRCDYTIASCLNSIQNVTN